MSYWNYRVMRRTYPVPKGCTAEVLDEIHEVYYNNDHTVEGWTENPVAVISEPGEMQRQVDWLMEAAAKPVLDYKTGEPISE